MARWKHVDHSATAICLHILIFTDDLGHKLNNQTRFLEMVDDVLNVTEEIKKNFEEKFSDIQQTIGPGSNISSEVIADRESKF